MPICPLSPKYKIYNQAIKIIERKKGSNPALSSQSYQARTNFFHPIPAIILSSSSSEDSSDEEDYRSASETSSPDNSRQQKTARIDTI